MNNDHRVPIVAFRNDLEETLRTVFDADPDEPVTLPDGDVFDDPMGYFDSFFLEVLVWRGEGANDGRCITEWLLGCGGPTVRLTYDDRWDHGTLFHSWGKCDLRDTDRREVDFDGGLCEQLVELCGVAA